jgi:hypothetical protein
MNNSYKLKDPHNPIILNGNDSVISAQFARDMAARNKDDSGARRLLRRIFQTVTLAASYGMESVHLSINFEEYSVFDRAAEKLKEFGFRVDIYKDCDHVAASYTATVIWAEQEKSTEEQRSDVVAGCDMCAICPDQCEQHTQSTGVENSPVPGWPKEEE